MKNMTAGRKTNGILPEPTLRRLPWYLAYIELLEKRGVEHVSSTDISRATNVDSAQIAKDLSLLDLRGKTRIGYEVGSLASKLAELLGFRVRHRAYILGAGSLGSALAGDKGLARYGLQIVAAFDTDPAKTGTEIAGMPVYDIASLRDVMHTSPATIAILSVPPHEAQRVATTAIEAGIRALWNFTPFRVKAPRGVVVANTSIYAHLALIYNRLTVNSFTPPAIASVNSNPE